MYLMTSYLTLVVGLVKGLVYTHTTSSYPDPKLYFGNCLKAKNRDPEKSYSDVTMTLDPMGQLATITRDIFSVRPRGLGCTLYRGVLHYCGFY